MAFGAISRYHFYWFLHPKSIISTGRARYHFQKFLTEEKVSGTQKRWCR